MTPAPSIREQARSHKVQRCEHSIPCRSELAREKRPGNAFIQTARVIVDVHRRNAARSKLAPTASA